MSKPYEEIIENYINGNISDFRKNLKGLTKIEILDLMLIWIEFEKPESVLKIVARYL